MERGRFRHPPWQEVPMMMSLGRSILSACAMVLAACAGTPEAPSASRTEPAASAEPANCIRYTGTRIPIPEGHCVAHGGRVFTAEQLRKTGASSVAEALRMLGAY
jgi:hypothetical protein